MAGDILDHPIETPVGDVPIIPVTLMVFGAYLAWFGVHYWGSDTRWPTDPLKAVLQGKPIPVPDTSARKNALTAIQGAAQTAAANTSTGNPAWNGNNPVTGVPAPTGPIAPGSRSAIAQYALRYQGAGYVWGGPADKPGNWDCSSFVSYVLGHDNQLKLPGGGHYGDPGYPPHTHGPTTNDYMLFGQPLAQAEVQPGDLVVTSEHMGIIVSPIDYISALNPSAGTHVENFGLGVPGGPAVFRRVVG